MTTQDQKLASEFNWDYWGIIGESLGLLGCLRIIMGIIIGIIRIIEDYWGNIEDYWGLLGMFISWVF